MRRESPVARRRRRRTRWRSRAAHGRRAAAPRAHGSARAFQVRPRRHSRRGSCRARAHVRATSAPGATEGRCSGQSIRVPRAVVCPDKFRGTLRADEAAHAMAAGLARAGFDDVVEMPMADGGEGTLETLLAARGGSRRTDASHGAARCAGRGGVGRVAGWSSRSSRWRARAGSRWFEAATIRCARAHAAPASSSRPCARRGSNASSSRSAGARQPMAVWPRSRRCVGRCRGSTSRSHATSRRRSWTPARVYGPQKGATEAQVALLTRRLEMLAEQYRARTGIDVTKLTGAGAAGGLAGGLAAIGAQLVPGFEAIAEAVGLEARARGRRSRGHRRRKAGCVESRGQGRRRRARVGGRPRRSQRRRSSPARRPTTRAQPSPNVRTPRCSRSPTACGSTPRPTTRAALLVEEAAIEAGRTALGTRET